MISIAICEDSIPIQAEMEKLVLDFLPDGQVEVFSSGEELLACLSEEEERFSIYMMDISLPGISGIETAEKIRRKDPYALLIYVTDYKEYVYQVFETLPFRFLTKPIERAVFQKVLTDAINYFQNRIQLFHFHIGRKQFQIPFQEIVYLESRLRQITLYTLENSYEFYGRLPEVLSALDSMFFARTHVSYVVNMEYIFCLGDKEITLQSGIYIPVSKKYRDELRRKHLQYLKWRAHQ